MDETIYVIFTVQFDFALDVWFSIQRLKPQVNVTQIQGHCMREAVFERDGLVRALRDKK